MIEATISLKSGATVDLLLIITTIVSLCYVTVFMANNADPLGVFSLKYSNSFYYYAFIPFGLFILLKINRKKFNVDLIKANKNQFFIQRLQKLPFSGYKKCNTVQVDKEDLMKVHFHHTSSVFSLIVEITFYIQGARPLKLYIKDNDVIENMKRILKKDNNEVLIKETRKFGGTH